MRVLILLVFTAFSFTASANDDSFSFKGYQLIDQQAFERIYNRTDTFTELGLVIGERSGFGPFGGPSLLDLLGIYPNGNNDGEMVNGDPNSMNTMLYFLLFDKMASSIVFHCSILEDPVATLNYNPNFMSSMYYFCRTKLEDAPPGDPNFLYYIENLWMQLMGFEAPEEEYLAWKEYLTTTTFESAEDRYYQALISIFMNPYFFINN